MQDWPCDDLYGMIINNVDECDYFLLEKSIQYMYKSHTVYNFHDITDITHIGSPSGTFLIFLLYHSWWDFIPNYFETYDLLIDGWYIISEKIKCLRRHFFKLKLVICEIVSKSEVCNFQPSIHIFVSKGWEQNWATYVVSNLRNIIFTPYIHDTLTGCWQSNIELISNVHLIYSDGSTNLWLTKTIGKKP